ncbi:MAG TPA: glycosyltransferase family 39 protein [bacterium]|nr:glycosyltransferase family 39 protein [bacterium]HQJ64269.1 glycosyltransferase family 39 protein [bacterium]
MRTFLETLHSKTGAAVRGLAQQPTLLMLLTLAAGALLRLLLMQVRWINPDEGAHLLDGRLVWQGLQPVIDYGSRQPLYAYLLALFIKLGGATLNAGRLLPLLASLGSGWLIYRIGTRLYDPLRGWLAAAVYLFLPGVLIWSTVVKTEMPAVFLCLLSAWFLLRALHESGLWSFYLLSGIAAALAWYVRQSTLYLPLAAALFLLFATGSDFQGRWRALGLFVAGYVGTCLLAALYYWGPLSGRELLFSQINPLNLVWNRLAHTLGILPAQQRVVDSEGFRILDQDPAYTLAAWRDSILFSLFIIAAALGSLRRPGGAAAGRTTAGEERFRRFIGLWLVILVLAYAFQSVSRGFYTQYFLEALPALLLLGIRALPAVRPAGWITRFALLGLLYGVLFACFRLAWRLPLHWLAVVGLGLLFAGVVLGLEARHRRRPLRFGALLFAAAFFISAAWSGRLITPRYECVWPPYTLDEVVHLLCHEGKPADQVLSGGMVWTYAAGMQPYEMVSHPTIYYMKYDAGFEARFTAHPPAFIVLDGYTEKKFYRYWDFIQDALTREYYRVGAVGGTKHAVEVWRLQEEPAAAEPGQAALEPAWLSGAADRRETAPDRQVEGGRI